MFQMQSARREEINAGSYKLTIIYDSTGRVVGAVIEGPRLARPIYIAARERVILKLPKSVRKILRRYGFNIES
ncbi:MAG: hypothetical protein ABWW70_04740 [Thermoproteota archaeon]